MDLSSLFYELSKQSPIIIALVAAIVWLAKRDVKSDRDNRAAMIRSENECIKREGDLSARLRQVEDRQHGEHFDLLTQATNALVSNAEALKVSAKALALLADTNSDLHRAIKQKKGAANGT